MDSDQDQSECPLCLEILEADDMNFFPCTCCYQICRFCWHRIRTDENGLCPACRKPYSENPAQFKPLTDEEFQQVKRERKTKDSNKKPKISESRKHLTNLRVVQRNLVFVNGLSSRLADTEVLRRFDHFGKFGKIIKLVTSPAHNGQTNSICVYITYSRSDEALRAIQSISNQQIDGRTLKATLGTTKYCSRYLKGAVCQKTDCLYLHEPGDPSASFTKEQMQQGLHLDYEKKLMEQYVNPKAKETVPTPNIETDSSVQRPTTTIDDEQILVDQLTETNLNENSSTTTFENDELGFDPCSLFMSALASDIENERQPTSSYSTSQTFYEDFSTQQKSSYRFPMTFAPSRTQWNGTPNDRWNLRSDPLTSKFDLMSSQWSNSLFPPTNSNWSQSQMFFTNSSTIDDGNR